MVAPALVFAGGVAVGAAVATNALRARLARRRPRRVLVGLEVAEAEGWHILRRPTSLLKTKKKSGRRRDGDRKTMTRVGVFTNHTGVCPRTGRHVVDMLHACASVDVRAVFAPEHGFRGEKQAGHAPVAETCDVRTGARVVDAYQTRGDPAALARVIARADVDCVVFDVQDVGARFYTYLSSLYDLLVAVARLNHGSESEGESEGESESESESESARRGDDATTRATRKKHRRERERERERKKKSRRRVRVVVLDRPNPLGGLVTEGPTAIEAGFGSFVARVAVPIRHGMTLGELALLFNTSRFVGADPDNPSRRALDSDDVRVARLKRWRREMAWEDTRLPWVPPSPNVPSPTSALAYVGTCLLEATNASEGRGTTTPFELVGAPWADARLAREMNRREPNGAGDEATRRKKKWRKRFGGSSSTRDTTRWTRSMNARPAPACVWREAHFTPSWGKEKDVPCVGAAALFSRRDDDDYSPVRASVASRALFLEGVEVLLALKKLYPREFQWREGPGAPVPKPAPSASRPDTRRSRVERASARARVLASPTKRWRSSRDAPPKEGAAEGRPHFIDLLTGSPGLRLAMDGAADPEQRRLAVEREGEKWEKQLLAFEKSRRDALLYD
jgi:uncharacterized protein YbbC (DUF1343 family)